MTRTAFAMGLFLRLQLLSIPPRGDAVTFNCIGRDYLSHGLSHCQQSILTDALIPSGMPESRGLE